MFLNYRKSLLTTSIALALVSASGAALAGEPCEKDWSNNSQANNSQPDNSQSNNSQSNNDRWNNSNDAQWNKASNNQANKGYMHNQDVTAARQESRIETTFALNSTLRANDLDVSVKDGKATLTGTVEEEVSKDLANAIALNAEGIDSVDNQIKVEPDYSPAAYNSQERDFGQVVDDATITAAVKSKLLWSQNTEGLEMDVDTNNGKVTLTGDVESDEAKIFATRTAENTRGVESVDNRLVVNSSNASSDANDFVKNASADISDGWITTKVNSTFMYSANLQSNDIEVDTDQGVVTLSGTVHTNNERDQAIEIAENIRGVKSVTATDLTLSDRSNLSRTGLTQNLSNPDSE